MLVQPSRLPGSRTPMCPISRDLAAGLAGLRAHAVCGAVLLTTGMRNEVRVQDLRAPRSRMLAVPRSRFVMTGVGPA